MLLAHRCLRSPSPQINAYSTPEDMESFTQDAPVTKSGATLTYGPYNNIPSSANREFVEDKQKRISLQYVYPNPVLEVSKLERSAEISHWGANLNIQDNIWLHNAGPAYVPNMANMC
jgi:oligosaccharyltransferase complex subunit alpha (ribophorin I)